MSAASGASAPQMSVGFGATPSAAVGKTLGFFLYTYCSTTTCVPHRKVVVQELHPVRYRQLQPLPQMWLLEYWEQMCLLTSAGGRWGISRKGGLEKQKMHTAHSKVWQVRRETDWHQSLFCALL